MTLRTLKTSSSTLKDRLLSRYRVLNEDVEKLIEETIWDYVLERKPIQTKEVLEKIENKTGEKSNDCLINFLINSMYKEGLLLGYSKENNIFLPKSSFKTVVTRKFDGVIKVPLSRLMLIGLKTKDICCVQQTNLTEFVVKSYNPSGWIHMGELTQAVERSGISFFPNGYPFSRDFPGCTKYTITIQKDKTLLVTTEI